MGCACIADCSRQFALVLCHQRYADLRGLCQAEKGELEVELSRQKAQYTELQATITHSAHVTERLEAEVERLQTKLERDSGIRKTLEESELVNSSLHESLRRLTQEVVSSLG